MSAVHVSAVLEQDGEVTVTGLPFRKGETVRLIVQQERGGRSDIPYFTGQQILDSGIVGIWEDRDDIGDSSEYARKLRKEAWTRKR